ncbi:MAG: hypothetical protein ABJZ55_21845 [Fuerstiella sp.]
MSNETEDQMPIPFVPSPADFEKVEALANNSCPRRYCWHWRPTNFAWEISPENGCGFLKAKLRGWKNWDKPCCRSHDAASSDHYETQDDLLKADGVDATRWVNSARKRNAGD